MGLQPTLDNLRIVQQSVFIDDSNPPKKRLNYVKQSKGHLGLVHTKLWESIEHNNRHTMRLDRKIVNEILSKTGPHGRRGKSQGRPASGIRHLLRREIMLLLNMEYSKLCQILFNNKHYKSGKKQDITLVMPDLSIALNELKQELISIESGLVNHLVFKRMWAPCLARLVELVWLHKTSKRE